jgi:hypothetical protein
MLALALITTSLSTTAQNLSFGPTAGFGHSWTNAATGSMDKRFHAAYNIGGKLVYSFMTNWGVSGDLKFSSEGQTIGTDADNKIMGRTNYIRIPLQGIYFFGKYGDRIRPKVSLGPSFGFLVGGAVKTYQNGNEIFNVKATDVMKTFDIGATVAGGLNVRVATATWLNADLAYYHGFTDVPETGEGKNRNIGINVGVTFPLGTVRPAKSMR